MKLDLRNLTSGQAVGVGCLAVIGFYLLMFIGLMALIFVYAMSHGSTAPG